MPSERLTENNINYRKTIFNLLNHVKRYASEESYQNFITDLQDRLEQVPNNDYEQSAKFFEEATRSIISGLQDYYDITYEKVIQDNLGTEIQSDKFILKKKDDIKEQYEMFKKYRNMPRFLNSFLQNHNRDLFYKMRGLSAQDVFNSEYPLNENNEHIILRNQIASHSEVFLPVEDRRTSFYRGTELQPDYLARLQMNVSSACNYHDSITEIYEQLKDAVVIFDRQLRESLRVEHLRFGIATLKKLLSSIIIPVSLIEDEVLRKACEESGRKVFVRKPTMKELMPMGCSVHVYASHDLDDDSSYIAKPILISDELPKDTEELKYLGVGQYTDYDDESVRSLNGSNPFVINNNVYVKAVQEDFEQLIPDELLQEITLCEELLQSINNQLEVVKVSDNSYLSNLIREIKASKTLNPQEVVDRFLKVHEMLDDQIEQSEQDAKIPEQYVFLEVKRSLNIHPSLMEDAALLVVDNNGKYGALRRTAGGYEIFTNHNADECIKALGWKKGMYSVYDINLLNMPRSNALKKLYVGGQ